MCPANAYSILVRRDKRGSTRRRRSSSRPPPFIAKRRTATMPDRSRSLTLADLAALTELSASVHEPRALHAAVDALVRMVIGHRLFTILRVHEAALEVERIYSSNTAAYPVGGRKKKQGTPWSKVVLDQGEVFIARTPEEVRTTFDDHALIF